MRREESDFGAMNAAFVNKTLKCLPQVFILCSNSRKSHKGAAEECPGSEHDAERRSEGPASKGTQILHRSGDGASDLDDITSKKVGGCPTEAPVLRNTAQKHY